MFYIQQLTSFGYCFPGAARGKEPTHQCRRHKGHRFNPWVWKTPWRRKWQPTPAFLPGEFHEQKSLKVIVHRVTKSQTDWSDLAGTHSSYTEEVTKPAYWKYTKKKCYTYHKFQTRSHVNLRMSLCYFIMPFYLPAITKIQKYF